MLIIAEIGQAHEGSLGMAHSYIEALSKTGVHAVKFQTHIAEAESSIHEPFRVQFSQQDKTRYDYWKRMEFSLQDWRSLKNHCDSVGLEFISSPFSCAAVDLLEEIGVNRYKIGSGEVNNHLLLNKIAETEKPVILSSGLSSLDELDESVSYLKNRSDDVSILQCTTEYPTKPQNWGLHYIQKLKNRFDLPIGYSDHSGEIYPCLAAYALGAEVFEFHVVFDKRQFGPDSCASLTIKQIEKLVQGLNMLEISLSNNADLKNDIDPNLKSMFGKSLAINQDIIAGDTITIDLLESKKPSGYGVDAKDFDKVIGKKVNKNLSKWDFINYEDINE